MASNYRAVDFAGRDQQPPTARDIYRRRRSTVSLYTMAVRLECIFSHSVIFFISEVALLRKKDCLGKTTCDWLFGYDAAFVKLL